MAREIIGRDVDVYRNLHRNCWSVRCRKSRRVVAHASAVVLTDVEFKVSESGRQRVLREKRKNVHAFARGTVDMLAPVEDAPYVPVPEDGAVSYNPYKAGHFYRKEDGSPIHEADRLLFHPQGSVFEREPTPLTMSVG